MENQVAYNAESIKSFEGLEAIRKRPTMYIGQNDPFRLVQEVVGNNIDEYNSLKELNIPSSNEIIIHFDNITKQISMRDFGRGIPIEKLRDCVEKIHTGGKFDNNVYKHSIGLNGVGLKAANALSSEFRATSYRWLNEEPKQSTVLYLRGKFINEKTQDQKAPAKGQLVSFTPDKEIFGEFQYDERFYRNYFEILSFINVGIAFNLHMEFEDRSINEVYKSDRGIEEMLEKKVIKAHRKVIPKAIAMSNSVTDPTAHGKTEDDPLCMAYEVVFNWCADTREERIYSFVNGIGTQNHGYHVSGLKTAIADIIRNDMKEMKLPDVNNPVIYQDIFEGFFAVITASHSDPLFSTQIKDSFTSENFEPFIKAAVTLQFQEWIKLNQNQYKAIVNTIALSAKARIAATNARKAIKASAATTSTLSLVSIDKYKPCRSKDPELCELFIVEGESAGGSAKSACNGEFQAIYMLRGVPPNVYDSKDITKYLNTEGSPIGDLVKVYGCGMGKSFDLSRLRHHKIIFMCDADVDGSHIKSLLLGFHFRYYPELIAEGHIYLANPPLFKFGFGKNRDLYIPNMDAYWHILDNSVMKDFEICALNGRTGTVIRNMQFFKQYLYYLRNYFETVEIAGKQVNVHPELLEHIIINYNSIMDKKDFTCNKWAFKRYYDENLKCECIEGIYNNIFHKIEMTSHLYELCAKITNQLRDIHWSNIILRHKASHKTLGPSPYQISKTIDRIVRGAADIIRIKGLGEMRPKQLWDTTMNPETRTLTQVTMDTTNMEYYEKQLDIFIGSNIDGRKDYYRQYL